MLLLTDELIDKSKFAYIIVEKQVNSSFNIELANQAAKRLLNFDRSENKLLATLAEKNKNLACLVDIIEQFEASNTDYKRYTLQLGYDLYTTHISRINENQYLFEILKEYKHDISEISHELKRPIQNIKTLTETLLMGAKDKPLMCDKFLNNINDEIDRLSDLVKNLLKLSQLGDLSTLMSTAESDLSELTHKASQSFKDKVQSKSIAFEMFCDGVILKKIDSDLYNHLITNLLDNALKYNVSEGFIDLCLTKKSLKLRNSSIGVKEEDLNDLFNKFFRSSSSARISGTGLGLTIVKDICDLFSWKASATCTKDNVFEISIEF